VSAQAESRAVSRRAAEGGGRLSGLPSPSEDAETAREAATAVALLAGGRPGSEGQWAELSARLLDLAARLDGRAALATLPDDTLVGAPAVSAGAAPESLPAWPPLEPDGPDLEDEGEDDPAYGEWPAL
jgi:hypothetical protein